MKTLGKFKINPEKVINNEELVNLRGGYGENCGLGFVERCCSIIPCQGCGWSELGIVCLEEGQDEWDALIAIYPDLQAVACGDTCS
jgi:hypothetical protein